MTRSEKCVLIPPRAVWHDGLDAFRSASDNHAAPGDHLLVPAAVNLQPAFAVYLRAPGERRHRLGLPMSFPPSRGFNQDELNAKEVR